MKCDSDLTYARTNEDQLAMLSEKDYKDLFDEKDDEQEYYRL